MADMKLEISTSDCKEGEVYSHDIDVKEGQSLVDAMLFAVESAALLYNSKGVVSITIYPEGVEE